jgi:hypothetical protein
MTDEPMSDCGDMLDDPARWLLVAKTGGAVGVCNRRTAIGCTGAMRPETDTGPDGELILAAYRVTDATVAHEARCDRCGVTETLFADGRTAAYAAERSRRDRGITTHRQRATNPPTSTTPVDRS